MPGRTCGPPDRDAPARREPATGTNGPQRPGLVDRGIPNAIRGVHLPRSGLPVTTRILVIRPILLLKSSVSQRFACGPGAIPVGSACQVWGGELFPSTSGLGGRGGAHDKKKEAGSTNESSQMGAHDTLPAGCLAVARPACLRRAIRTA